MVVNQDENTPEMDNSPSLPWFKQWWNFLLSKQSWVQMAVYAFLVLAGQAVGTLLGRVYFNNGGNSKWMGTLVQVGGFPILFPLQWMTTSKQSESEPNSLRYHMTVAVIYLGLGFFVAVNFVGYTYGIQYLAVSTFTLISATQLAFNALCSNFINKEKITPYTFNAVVVLMASSILLAFGNDPGDANKTTKANYITGILCTLAASGGYGLLLSITQYAQDNFIQKETTGAILDMSIYQNLFASMFVLMGLFGFGEWKTLPAEMEAFTTGSVSYVMILVGTAVAWQAFTIGSVGLIYTFSSLFANVVGILGLPLAPLLAVIFLHDSLTGLKAMSMGLAIWGFVSYTYPFYNDWKKENKKMKSSDPASEVSLVEIIYST